MSNEDVESLIAEENSPAQPPVEEVLDAQRDDAATGLVSTTGPLDLVGPGSAATADEPALAPLINNTGDDGGASSG